jgi:hypothetical protein
MAIAGANPKNDDPAIAANEYFKNFDFFHF